MAFNLALICSNADFASDFDLMLLRKKDEKSGRRRRKDIDIINDNDDIIAQLISDMKHAAQVCAESTPKKSNAQLMFNSLTKFVICFIGRSTIKPRTETSHQ